MPQNILHTLFFFVFSFLTNKEKRVLLHHSVWFCWVIIKAVHCVGGRRRRQQTSVLRVVHSWFLTSVCVFLFITSTRDIKEQKKKKKGSSSSSLMHCHYNISTWRHVIHKFQGIEQKHYKSLLVWWWRDELRTETKR